jgi:hypothetical protein
MVFSNGGPSRHVSSYVDQAVDEGLGHDVVFLVVAFLWCELPVS